MCLVKATIDKRQHCVHIEEVGLFKYQKNRKQVVALSYKLTIVILPEELPITVVTEY